jgi:DNA repair photolyase
MPAPLIEEICVKSVLNRVNGMPFAWSINPYRGCVHGCVFCYARRTHWFLNEDGVNDWSSKIFAKVNAPEVLRAELSRRSWSRESVAIGTATDPYQAAERRYGITRRILEALRDHRTPASIVTRSPLAERDADVMLAIAERASMMVAVSIATVDEKTAREIEPTVAAPVHRLDLVRRLTSAGIHAGIALAPVLPGINDSAQSLGAVFEAGKAAGAKFIWHGALYLGDVTRDAFFQYLQQRRPELVGGYREMYKGRYLDRARTEAIDMAARLARTLAGFASAKPPTVHGEQLDLLARERRATVARR